jgi:hypothetical protein
MEKIGITGPQAFEKLVGRLRSTDKLPVPKSKKYWVFYQSKTIFSAIAAVPSGAIKALREWTSAIP